MNLTHSNQTVEAFIFKDWLFCAGYKMKQNSLTSRIPINCQKKPGETMLGLHHCVTARQMRNQHCVSQHQQLPPLKCTFTLRGKDVKCAVLHIVIYFFLTSWCLSQHFNFQQPLEVVYLHVSEHLISMGIHYPVALLQFLHPVLCKEP